MMHEYLKRLIEKLYDEGKVTKEERDKLIKAVDELKEEKGGDAMKNA